MDYVTGSIWGISCRTLHALLVEVIILLFLGSMAANFDVTDISLSLYIGKTHADLH